jgi:hypothetical protein
MTTKGLDMRQNGNVIMVAPAEEISARETADLEAQLAISELEPISDFHRNWVEQGLLKPQDFNFNLLQYPYAQRIDLLPESYKQKVKEKIEKHLEWLRPLDNLTRATKGFESGLNYMMRRDNNKDIQQFKDTMKKMDVIRDENILETFPELKELYEAN